MDSAKPLISVIIPTHNRADLLPRAVMSVLKQTFTDFEAIIVDDASDDDTEAVVKQIGDNRVRYIRHTHNLGGPAARNTGIREARGEYIAFLDDDDEYFPNKLAITLQALNGASDKTGLAYSKVRYIGYFDKVLLPYIGKSGNIFLDMLGGPMFHTSSTLIKKKFIVFYDETLPRYQDVDFHLRILEKAEAVFADQITALWHQEHQRNRITADIKALEDAVRIMEKKYFDEKGYHTYKDVYARFLKTVGNISILENNALRVGRNYLRRSLKVQLNLIVLVDFLTSFFGSPFFRLIYRMKKYIYLKINHISLKDDLDDS